MILTCSPTLVQVSTAAAKCDGWAASIERCKAALEAEVRLCCLPPLPSSSTTPPTTEESTAWVSAAAWKLLGNNHAQIEQMHAEAAALLSSTTTAAAVARSPPGLDRVVTELSAFVSNSAVFVAESSLASASGSSGSSGSDEGFLDAAGKSVEAAVKEVLLWAQGMAAATSKSSLHGSATHEGVGSKSSDSTGQTSAGGVEDLPTWLARWERGAGIKRATAVVSAISEAVSVLASATNTTSSSNTTTVAIALKLAGLAPAVRLMTAALQQWCVGPGLSLHKATAKLAYICTAICATLVTEGYCMPEGEMVEGKVGMVNPLVTLYGTCMMLQPHFLHVFSSAFLSSSLSFKSTC